MIRVSTDNPAFNQALRCAMRSLPVEPLETPRQYGQRWREAFRCRVDPEDLTWPNATYIFDHDEDYVVFMLKWS